jgi:hypothetical protein
MSKSPLGEIIRADVEEARAKLLNDVVEPWGFFNSHCINIKKADGSSISISGGEFSGSARLVFWDGFIDDHLKKSSRTLIESIRQKAGERNIPVEDALADCLMHLENMVQVAFHRMARIEQLLLGKGFPDRIPRRDVSGRIKNCSEQIRRLVDAEIQCVSQDHGKSKASWLDATELKPNFFGIGINLNWLIPKAIKEWRVNKHAHSITASDRSE